MIASDILDRCSAQLNDSARTRWTERMMLNYLTDAIRQLALNRPDAHPAIVTMKLERGKHRQKIPSGNFMLLKVVRNMGVDGETPGKPLTMTTREAMDSCYGVQDIESDVVFQYAFVQATPEYFWVYPKPGDNVYVELECAASVPQIADMNDEIPVATVWAEPLREYVMYLAYSLNGASQVDNARAQNHLQQYYLAIGNEQMARSIGDPYKRSSDLQPQ